MHKSLTGDVSCVKKNKRNTSNMKLKIICKVEKEMFDKNKKKYMKFRVDEQHIRSIQESKNNFLNKKYIDDPLVKDILTIKIPFRYNRVMCDTGNNVIYDFKNGDNVTADVEFCGTWNIGDYCGYAWKLDKLEYMNI